MLKGKQTDSTALGPRPRKHKCASANTCQNAQHRAVTAPQEQLRRQRQVDVSSRLARLHSETETPVNKLTRLRPPGIVAVRKQLCHPVFVTVCPGQSTCTLSEHTSVPLRTDPEPSHQIRS